MTEEVSKTQINRLGDRLRKGNITESDLRLLDDYRLSFTTAHEIVIRTIQEKLRLEPTGRPAKSRTSISEKLHRESSRLTQIQDIAGCRLVVSGIIEQDRVIESLVELFEGAKTKDRRDVPSYGYRAVHVIANYGGKLVEIQVRTSLQHLWAELSEKLSDVIDPTIKYGGGEGVPRDFLDATSSQIAQQEWGEKKIGRMQAWLASKPNKKLPRAEAELAELQVGMRSFGQELSKKLRDAIEIFSK